MARLIHLEILDARGQPRARVRVDAFPATLGRAYDADVILDDPFVDPRHARLRPDGNGAFTVEDLGSVNGLFPGGGGARQRLLDVRPGDTFRIGRTTLRVCDASQAVAPALVDRERAGSRLTGALGVPASLALCALALALLSLYTWLGSYERIGLARIVSDSLPGLVAIAVWAGAWALAGRIVTHRFAFLQHMAVAAAMTIAVALVATATEWLGFFFPATDAFGVLESAASVGLGVLLLYSHLTFASHLSRRARWRAAAAVTVALAAVLGFVALAEEEEFTTTLDYASALKPVGTRWLPAVTIDRFTDDATRLRAAVDSLAEE